MHYVFFFIDILYRVPPSKKQNIKNLRHMEGNRCLLCNSILLVWLITVLIKQKIFFNYVKISKYLIEFAHLYKDKYKHRDKVISSRHSILISQAEKIHDGRAHTQDALHFVPWCLVCTDRPNFCLHRRPRSLFQIHLLAQTAQLQCWKRHVFKMWSRCTY